VQAVVNAQTGDEAEPVVFAADTIQWYVVLPESLVGENAVPVVLPARGGGDDVPK
jgi:hypothetical protein